jgi:hypothetical protein
VKEPPQIKEKVAKITTHNRGEKAVRQSERIKSQDMGGMKIADKADMAAKKRNLEGNTFIHKNSFAVLDTLTLIHKSSKMGGNSTTINLEHIDLLKDLEMARNNIKERVENLDRETEEANIDDPPLEEMKYIAWRSDSSDLSNLEGFQVVSRKKKRNTKRSHQQK